MVVTSEALGYYVLSVAVVQSLSDDSALCYVLQFLCISCC